MALSHILLLCLVSAVVLAAPDGYGYGKGYESEIYHSQDGYGDYKFNYHINDHHTGDKHSQYEEKHKYDVKGSYALKDPYGYERKVDYYADKYGTRQHIKGSYNGLYVHTPYYTIEPNHHY